MSKMIQLRNVPDALLCNLKSSSRQACPSRTNLLTEIKEIPEKSTLAEFRERLHRASRFRRTSIPAHLVREARGPMIVSMRLLRLSGFFRYPPDNEAEPGICSIEKY